MAFRRSLAHFHMISILIIATLAIHSLASAQALDSSAPRAEVTSPSGGTATDPSQDPWLAEEGPAVPATVEEPLERVVATWQATPVAAHARAAALRRTRLELGLGDLPAPAAVIVEAATEDDPELFTEMANGLAPRTPAFRVDHGLALWGAGDIGGSILSFGSAAWATMTQLPAQLWVLENVSFLLLLVVVSASLAFILIAALRVVPHAAHDLGDLLSSKTPIFARHAALAALVLAPVVFGEGIAGLTLALFTLAFAYGASRQRSALAMAAVILLIGILPLARVVSIATTLVDQDPISKSVMAVLADTATAADVDRLERASGEEVAAAHALAYRARRYGLAEESSRRLDELLARNPSDAVALANRGNIENRNGRTEAAIEYYERAAAEAGSATLLFNLSQAYARVFRMEEYEATLSQAQALDDDAVAELSSLDDAKLVADVEYPVAMIRDRLIARALDQASSRTPALEAFAPGLLGLGWLPLAAAFGLSALFSLLLAGRWDHASQCTRCGHRICTRCEETVWSEELCEDCHHLFQNPEATDPSLRMARLQALSERETRIDRLVLALSIAIPGFAGFAARRPDLSLFSLLLFGWFLAWVVWPSGVFADPLLMGYAAAIPASVFGVLSLLAYASVVGASLMMRKSR